MNSKERGLAPFLRKSVDRYPMWYGGAQETTDNIMHKLGAMTNDEALYDILGIDYKTIRPAYIGPAAPTFEDGSWLDGWGVRRKGLHYGQALISPLADAETIADIENYKGFPDPDNYNVKYSREQLEWAAGNCLIGGSWASFFHDATDLMDMATFFMNMYSNEEVAEALVEKCVDFYYEIDRRTFRDNPGAVDMYFIGNDFGSQRALLMSPDKWRKFFKPGLKKLVEQAKKNGCVTALHSCGDIHEIIGDLIEIGVDAINPIQVYASNMVPEVLVREYGADCVFFGGIDENEIMRIGTEKDVRDETRRIIDILGAYGRYIVAASHDCILPEIPAENIIGLFDEAKKCGIGKNQCIIST